MWLIHTYQKHHLPIWYHHKICLCQLRLVKRTLWYSNGDSHGEVWGHTYHLGGWEIDWKPRFPQGDTHVLPCSQKLQLCMVRWMCRWRKTGKNVVIGNVPSVLIVSEDEPFEQLGCRYVLTWILNHTRSLGRFAWYDNKFAAYLRKQKELVISFEL